MKNIITFFILFHSFIFCNSQNTSNEVLCYPIPNVLECFDGSTVNDSAKWWNTKRPELYNFFEEHVYGKMPDKKIALKYKTLRINNNALNGKAIRKELRIYFSELDTSLYMDILMYLPKNKDSVPIFLSYNFFGNQCINKDTGIYITQHWVPWQNKYGTRNFKATDTTRGIESERWPIDTILSSGYGIASIYCGDVDPDYDDGFKNGVHKLFYRSGQEKPDSNEWGTISAWAWGLSRAMDFLETETLVDNKRVIVLGHSRLGKAALWAGASDVRFAAVISNNSGCTGAKLSKRMTGESIEKINTKFPYWFCGNYKKYINKEKLLPVDQHELIALIAPRPVYIASASLDNNADPEGEFLATKFAAPVYELLGAGTLAADSMPVAEHPIKSIISYHLRTGSHNILLYDWLQYINFADRWILRSHDRY